MLVVARPTLWPRVLWDEVLFRESAGIWCLRSRYVETR